MDVRVGLWRKLSAEKLMILNCGSNKREGRRRHLRVPWTARRSNQSILKEISPGCSLEGLMLKLKLQYFGHLMRRVDSLEKTLMLGGIGGRRRRGRQRMRWLDGIADLMGVGLGWTPGVDYGQGGLACCNSWGCKESDMTERLNWTELRLYSLCVWTWAKLFKLSEASDFWDSALGLKIVPAWSGYHYQLRVITCPDTWDLAAHSYEALVLFTIANIIKVGGLRIYWVLSFWTNSLWVHFTRNVSCLYWS